MRVAIIGASGFVGSHLTRYLKDTKSFELVGISRSRPKEEIIFKKCDLFSLLDIENALEGCDVAIYLVHSMAPSAHLDQGNFKDYDLIVADNFLRAAKKHKIKHVIYLGGIRPRDKKELSEHLDSRLEIEDFIKSAQIPVTVFRAGMIMGVGGSSFNIMLNLIKRLPILGLPEWTTTKTQPVHIDYVVECICESINVTKHFNKTYELATNDIINYQEMLKITAEELKLKRVFLKISFINRNFSKIWISTISGAPPSLVYPLVESLNHEIIADPNLKFDKKHDDFRESLRKSLHSKKASEAFTPHAYKKGIRKKNNEVRSVQRLVLPRGLRAIDIAYEYMNWLPLYMNSFIRVKVTGEKIFFKLWPLGINVLILEHSLSRSSIERQLFYVTGGLLSKKTKRGRLEFREALDRKYVIAAIHEFKPALPWIIYKYTQAVIHLRVMNAFGFWLSIINKRNIEKYKVKNRIDKESNIL